MPLLLLPLLLSGCVDEFPVPTAVPYGGDGKGLSVEEAKTFFESYVSGKASRSGEPEEHDNGFYIQRLMLPVGEFVPSWEEGLSTDAPSLYSVDVPVQSDFSFRVLRVAVGFQFPCAACGQGQREGLSDEVLAQAGGREGSGERQYGLLHRLLYSAATSAVF